MDYVKQEEHEVPGLDIVKEEFKLEFFDDAFEDCSAEELGNKVIEQLVALQNLHPDKAGPKVSVYQDDHQYQSHVIIKEEFDCDNTDDFDSLNFTDEVLEPTLRRSSRRRCPRFTAEDLLESSDTEDTVCKYRKKMRIQGKSSSLGVRNKHFQQVTKLSSDLLVGSNKRLDDYTAHDKSLKTCNIGDRAFKRIQYLKWHHKRLHSGVSYPCDICERTFTKRNHLNDHVRLHTGEKPYSCGNCGKSFRVRGCLIQHVRTHTGERPFSCHICDKSFTQSTHLRVHIRSHNGDKRFKCNTCSRSFIRRFHLKLHMHVHRERKQKNM